MFLKRKEETAIERFLNHIFCLDNLELLGQLPDSSIDLIYCDILYNTGKCFNDFDDNLGTIDQSLGFYRPRLKEMARVLKPTGSIYIHCDYRLSHYLKVELDNVFGINNFRNEIIWCYAGGGIPKNDFPRKHDVILRYSKTDNYFYQPIYHPYSKGTLQRGRTKVKGKYAEQGLRKEGTPVNDWWDDIKPICSPTDKERIGYDTQKPKALLERIIKASSNVGDVVADFFIGSGTSLVIAKELGRNYVGCDINPRSIDVANQRLKGVNCNDL
ncbi:DNA-methyltransferase [Desulfosporosinus sp. SB140]|uniref:DNA-methyltransferase n=1 Tax=Desulfosporosinus paludis TaxID=3115649 RepID=UPI00388DF0BA